MATVPQFTSRPEVEVIVYRHKPTCKFAARDKIGRCSCRKHLYVRESRLRIATGKRSWDAARRFAVEWQDAHDPAKIKERERAAREQATHKLVEGAFDDFIADKKAASDNPDGFAATESKFKTLKKQLTIFLGKHNVSVAEGERVHYVHQISSALLDQWMRTWKAKTYWSKTKRRDNLVSFFEYCIDKKWMAYNAAAKDKGNPARGMMKITTAKGSTIPTLPFTPAQFNAVLAATFRYEESIATLNKKEVHNKSLRLHALVNLMRWSGLSITDAVTLGRDRLGSDNRLELHRTKTGTPVYLLLRPEIADELRHVPPGPDSHPDYFFWSGKGKKNKAASTWQKTFRKLWKLVTPPLILKDRNGKRIAPKSHMLRNTFAVELLKKKVSLDHVAVLLGDNPETVREHYFKWVPELQNILDDEVKRTWKTDPIVLQDADRAVSEAVN
ncbi:MAG TPA: site-specific integrase [Verrucomicrobiae bacterium]|nr:site-specific integrase [Verrucomicrobiae bacterium]